MEPNRPAINSQITFLYYADLASAADFYGQLVGLAMVLDEGWAKIYRVGAGAFLGIVDGTRGFHQPQEKSAVLVTLVVDDALAWYDYLRSRGARLLTPLQERADIQLRHFFLSDPGEYSVEIQQFLRPETARLFCQRATPPGTTKDN